jgi:CubicO group peptidase (beta-lactamase class C family)
MGPQLTFSAWAEAVVRIIRQSIPDAQAARKASRRILIRYRGQEVWIDDKGDTFAVTLSPAGGPPIACLTPSTDPAKVIVSAQPEEAADMLRALAPLRVLFAAVLSVAVFGSAAVAARGAEPSASAIDAAAQFAFPKKPHSGFSLAIEHAGRLTYAKGYGFRDGGTPDRFIPQDHNYYGMPVARATAARAAADPRTIYAVGSVTKQFTAAAILLLSDEHRLALDDAVGRYAPEFRESGLTLRMLLTQRSGLSDLNTLAFIERVRPLAKRADGTIDDLRVSREIAAQPRDFPAGKRFEYSNSNYFVLGTIVERIAREPLSTFLSERIFRPLGMTRTAFAAPAARDDVAVGYRIDDKSTVWRAYPWDLVWLGGAGAMTSTVEDLSRWNVALTGHRVLDAASLGEMWHGEDAGRGQGSYAMGWIEDALGSHRYLWHNGEVGGFHALNVIFPDDDLAFAILCNNQDAKPEYLLPGIAALYFPVSGLDRFLPRSGVVLIEASLAVGIGALAIAVVAVLTLKRFLPIGLVAALLALVSGVLLPTLVGFSWAGVAALIPVAGYVLAVRFIPRLDPKAGAKKTSPSPSARK